MSKEPPLNWRERIDELCEENAQLKAALEAARISGVDKMVDELKGEVVVWSCHERMKESRIEIIDVSAIFIGFGCDYEEFENGPANYSTAIIMLDDGQIKNVPVEQIKFDDLVYERLKKE